MTSATPSESAALKNIQARLRTLHQQYQQNHAAATQRTFSLEAYDDFLEDMPAGLLNRYINSGAGRAEFPWATGEAQLFISYCSAREFRKTIHEGLLTLCPGSESQNNLMLAQEILQARAAEARVRGYANYLEFLFAEKAESSVPALRNYLAAAVKELQPRYDQCLAQLQGLAQHRAGVAQLQPWDVEYFKRMFIEENFKAAEEKFSEYYPLPEVLPRVLDILSRVFELKFTPTAPANRWSTYQYSVLGKNGRRLGNINFDLFTRARKLDHIAYVTRDLADLTAHGRTRRLPVINVNCKFQRPARGETYHLEYDDLFILFHELGHAVADLYAHNNLSTLGHYEREEDLIEFYSNFLENFVYDEKILRHLSGHPTTGRKVPSDCVQQVLRSARMERVFLTYSQLINAQVDLELNLFPETPIATTVARIHQAHGYGNFSAHNYACAPSLFAPRGDNNLVGNAYCYPLGESLSREIFLKYQRAAGNLLAPKDFSVPDEIFACVNRRPFLASYKAVTGRKKLNLSTPRLMA